LKKLIFGKRSKAKDFLENKLISAMSTTEMQELKSAIVGLTKKFDCENKVTLSFLNPVSFI